MIHPGLKIDCFVIDDELGRGGFGSVYLAHEEATNKPVAIKFLHPKSLKSEDDRHAFINEMINQSRLFSCPNIVQVLRSLRYADRIGEHLGMVMEYVDGDPLDLYIQKHRLLPEYLAVAIFLQVLSGIDFAHRAQILHRDLKPGNIMIRPDGLVKIMDFGLAKVVQGSSGASESARAASLNYVAPERLQRLRVDQRSDIYSLGATLYEALTGHPPYDIEAGNWDDARSKHNGGACPGIRVFCPEHSKSLERLVARALAVEPAQRYADCAEMMSDLLHIWNTCPVPSECRPEFADLIAVSRQLVPAMGPGRKTDSAREKNGIQDFPDGDQRAIKDTVSKKKAGGAFPLTNGDPDLEETVLLICPDCGLADIILNTDGEPLCARCHMPMELDGE